MEPIILIPIFLSFFITFLAVPIWAKRAKKVGLEGRDVHKTEKRRLAEAGGVPVVFGFVLGFLSYIAIKTFYFNDMAKFVEMFALLSVILIHHRYL